MIKLVKGDITQRENIQAIVNAANESLLGGAGVDGAIHRAAGPELLEECRKIGGCPTGQARLSQAYNLPNEYVIHTVGPIWQGGQAGEAELLASAYRSSMELARDHKIRTLAFPSISTGAYGYPVEEAASIAIQTAKTFIKENPKAFDSIEWVLFDDHTYKVYENVLG